MQPVCCPGLAWPPPETSPPSPVGTPHPPGAVAGTATAKQTSNFCVQGKKKKECSDVRVSYFFYASLKHVSTTDFMFALVLLQLQLSFGVVFLLLLGYVTLLNTMRSKQWHHEYHLQTKFHTTCSTFTTEAVCGGFLFCISSKYNISFCCLLMYIFL